MLICMAIEWILYFVFHAAGKVEVATVAVDADPEAIAEMVDIVK
jgi:hypothetical protein